ncbi:hypothetical protein Tco_0009791 [Tanacetum coccineum]
MFILAITEQNERVKPLRVSVLRRYLKANVVDKAWDSQAQDLFVICDTPFISSNSMEAFQKCYGTSGLDIVPGINHPETDDTSERTIHSTLKICYARCFDRLGRHFNGRKGRSRAACGLGRTMEMHIIGSISGSRLVHGETTREEIVQVCGVGVRGLALLEWGDDYMDGVLEELTVNDTPEPYEILSIFIQGRTIFGRP